MNIRRLGMGAAGLVVAGAVAVGGLGAIGASAQTAPDGTQQTPRERPVDGQGLRMGGMVRGAISIHRAAAEVLGIDREALHAAMQSGKTLAQVGEEYGFSRDALKSGITSKVNQQLAQALVDGKITEEKKADILAGLNDRIEKALDATHTGRMGPGGPRNGASVPPEGMERGPRGSRPQP